MATELFPCFLSDARRYEQAERWWGDLWRDILAQTRQEAVWHSPWLHSDRDGNPIFSAINPARRLGVQVIQEAPESPDEGDLDYWVDWFGEEREADSVQKLVICCVLTDRTAPLIADVLREW